MKARKKKAARKNATVRTAWVCDVLARASPEYHGPKVSTYDDFLVYDVVSLIVVEREEVGQNAHHYDGRDPDEHIRGHQWGRGRYAVVSCHGHDVWVRRSGRELTCE